MDGGGEVGGPDGLDRVCIRFGEVAAVPEVDEGILTGGGECETVRGEGCGGDFAFVGLSEV